MRALISPAIVQVARDMGIAPDTVRTWRRRLLAARLDGPLDQPRPDRPPTIAVEQAEAVVVATLEELPRHATHRSRASMAQRIGLSKSTIGRIGRQQREPRALIEQGPLRARAPRPALDTYQDQGADP
jgi:transposase-like protein